MGCLGAIVSAATLIIIGLSAGQALANSEPPEGKSKRLDITFKVRGDTNWCQTGIKIDLSSKKLENYTKNPAEFQQMLGRIRAAVTSECPSIRAIGFYSSVQGEQIAVGESSKLTGWIYVPFPPSTIPICRGPEDDVICGQRWEAYKFARAIFVREGLKDILFTRYLTTNSGADLEFMSGKAVGRIIFVPVEEQIAGSARRIADFLTSTYVEQCQKFLETYPGRNFVEEAAYRGFSCQRKAKSEFRHMLIIDSGSFYQILTVSGFKKEEDAEKVINFVVNALSLTPIGQ